MPGPDLLPIAAFGDCAREALERDGATALQYGPPGGYHAWNEFLIALVLTSANAQTMPLQVAAQNATRGPQWWAMSVLIIIMITPVVVMAVALERFITRGILVGALKG